MPTEFFSQLENRNCFLKGLVKKASSVNAEAQQRLKSFSNRKQRYLTQLIRTRSMFLFCRSTKMKRRRMTKQVAKRASSQLQVSQKEKKKISLKPRSRIWLNKPQLKLQSLKDSQSSMPSCSNPLLFRILHPYCRAQLINNSRGDLWEALWVNNPRRQRKIWWLKTHWARQLITLQWTSKVTKRLW